LEAEPVRSCNAEKTAIVVYGRGVGTTLTVCTDEDCPVHTNNRRSQRIEQTATTAASEEEAHSKDKEREPEQQSDELQRQEERAEQRRQEFQRQQQEYEAQCAKKAELLKTRNAIFDRILENAPAAFTAAQLRVFLRALVTADPYSFAEDVFTFFAGDEADSDQREPEEVLRSTSGRP
jgi:ParB family chromosome partitioning protein